MRSRPYRGKTLADPLAERVCDPLRESVRRFRIFMKHWIWFAVAALMLVDAVGYTFGAIGTIRRGLNSTEPYWQKRLLLNLMLANQGLYLGAAIPLICDYGSPAQWWDILAPRAYARDVRMRTRDRPDLDPP
jgi:hypothetical protein